MKTWKVELLYGVLGEDTSDFNTLKVLIRRLTGNPRLPVYGRGYDGSGNLLKKGAPGLIALKDIGCGKFVVCHDSDGSDPELKRRRVLDLVVKPAGLDRPCCVVIPVQELEAWILADVDAIAKVFGQWKPAAVASPERIASPKELLVQSSRAANRKPLYSPPVHNERIAAHLDADTLSRKCPSFRPFHQFVLGA